MRLRRRRIALRVPQLKSKRVDDGRSLAIFEAPPPLLHVTGTSLPWGSGGGKPLHSVGSPVRWPVSLFHLGSSDRYQLVEARDECWSVGCEVCATCLDIQAGLDQRDHIRAVLHA